MGFGGAAGCPACLWSEFAALSLCAEALSQQAAERVTQLRFLREFRMGVDLMGSSGHWGNVWGARRNRGTISFLGGAFPVLQILGLHLNPAFHPSP